MMRKTIQFSAIALALACATTPGNAGAQVADLSQAKGDYSADVTVLQRNGTLAAGEPYRLQLNVSGPDPDIVTGTIPEDGIIRLKNLAGGEGGPSYILLVGKRNLEAERFELTGPEKHRTLEFTMAPAPGDEAPDILFQELFGDEKMKLSDYRGRFVFLDFWASWCGPCRKPMTELEALIKRKKGEWDGKVVAVALSIDDTPEAAQKFVQEQGWLSMDHYWSSEGEPGFFSDAQRAYRIESIPTSFLIDPDGIIVWRGHPGYVNVEKLVASAMEKQD